MSKRGLTVKSKDQHRIVLERPMVTRHYVMTWDLDVCVGCQIGPLCCPMSAVTHQKASLVDGRISEKPSVDIDPDKCVFCGICEVMCPKNAVSLQINGKHENPVIENGAFPELIESTILDPSKFDKNLMDFVISNCPTQVISLDPSDDSLYVDDGHCIRCRQCEIASKGAFTVCQPWQGSVRLERDLCVENCFACADICPTRALHIDDCGQLILADYYCIKCGACMQVCPIQPIEEDYTVDFESQGVKKSISHIRLTNADQLPILVERWRIQHQPVESGAWVQAILKMANEKVGAQEIDSKRALKRRDLLMALKGDKGQF